MIISVISGKGGTGKTTVSVNMASSLKDAAIIDCDVEEPNCHIFLKPEIKKKIDISLKIPNINEERCNFCGKCADICEYKAINIFKRENNKGKILILEHLCHSCSACEYFCDQKAIDFKNKKIGVIKIGSSNDLVYIGGKIEIGEIKTPFLINEVKKQALKINKKTYIIDGPPGASCSTVAAIKNSDFVILVTEPTKFGLNDLEIAIEIVKKMNIPYGVVINRWRDNYDFEKNLINNGIKVLDKIPYNREIAVKYSNGLLINDIKEYKNIFINIFKQITKIGVKN